MVYRPSKGEDVFLSKDSGCKHSSLNSKSEDGFNDEIQDKVDRLLWVYVTLIWYQYVSGSHDYEKVFFLSSDPLWVGGDV